ncbi:hypothetical protein MPSI1_002136 [Malassezia psittaci]|uniref:Arginine biosynthesis bifunctional protein ArgJ, mitochondrial n=1 Tax=Malassezia psittaci TaxID=1821823 RepID=A0AAF0FBK7_9BASI|nr:hypothetical protein MPSI1_002136 [Malassezia psittaci]
MLWTRQQTQGSKAERFVQHIEPESLPRGFVVASTYAGVKRAISPASSSAMPSAGVSTQSPKPDVSLIVSSVPASIAGVFTTNVFQAAPVVHAKHALQTSRAAFFPSQGPRTLAILANSGCANAVTGQEGLEDTKELLDLLRMELTPAITSRKAADSDVLMLSTGVIGVRLPKGVIKRAVQHLVHGQVLQSNPDAWLEAARAYMTTDSFPKLRTRSFTLGNRKCHLLGIDKGAGMIHPNMSSPQGLHATLLGVMLTDAPIEPATLQTCLAEAVRVSFNCISVDGDMSTNDTILAMANGQAPEVQEGDQSIARGSEISESSHPELVAIFQQELTELCLELAHLIVRDGEGAEKFVQVRVRGVVDYEQAHAIASSISTSALVKCAMHGEDANWGRILCAAGYAKRPESDWAIDPQKVNVSFVPPKGVRGVRAVRTLINGTPQDVDEAAAAKLLALEDICLEVDLQGGTYDKTQATAEAVYWTCDFSKEYITINGDYRT